MLNVNGLNVPIKRHRLTNWIKSQDSMVCCIQETHLHMQRLRKTQNKGMEEDLPTKWKTNKKKARVSILVSDKTDFKPTKIKKRQRMALHNNKGINAARRANCPKYICTQYMGTQIHKASS